MLQAFIQLIKCTICKEHIMDMGFGKNVSTRPSEQIISVWQTIFDPFSGGNKTFCPLPLRYIPVRAARGQSTGSATRRSRLRAWQTCRFPNICHHSPVELRSKRKEESWSSWGRIVTTSSRRNILEKPFASSVSFHCMGRWVGRIC